MVAGRWQKGLKCCFCGAVVLGMAWCCEATPDVSELVEWADQLIAGKKFDEAEKVLTENCLERGELYFCRAKIQLLKENYTAAAGLLYKGVLLDDDDCRFKLAQMRFAGIGVLKDLRGALELFKHVADNTGYDEACFWTGKMYAAGEGTEIDFKQAEKYLKLAADKGKHAIARYMLGVYYRDIKSYEQSFYYLELAAASGVAEAWGYLGGLHYFGQGVTADPRWAKLCYLAEEKLQPNARNEYNLGVIAMEKYDLADAMHWMKLAAAKGHPEATIFVKDTAAHARITERAKQASAGAKTVSSTGMAGEMITVPLADKFREKVWNFDRQGAETEIRKNIFRDRLGQERLSTPEFIRQPLQSNLLPPALSEQEAAGRLEAAFAKFLKERNFAECDRNLVERFTGKSGDMRRYRMWKLRDDLYLQSEVAHSGSGAVQMYYVYREDKTLIAAFDAIPDQADVTLVNGVLAGDPAAANNLGAIMLNLSGKRSFTGVYAEKLLKTAADRGEVAALYNLWVLYIGQNDAENASAVRHKLEKVLETVPANPVNDTVRNKFLEKTAKDIKKD